MFPTELRLRGTGTCSTAGRLVTALNQYLVDYLFALGGVTAVDAAVVVLLIVIVIVVAGFGIETRQRSLEDISKGVLATLGDTTQTGARAAANRRLEA